MSEAHNEHQSMIKSPKQLIVVVILAFLIVILAIALLVSYVGNLPKTGAGASDPVEAANERIRPVAQLDFKSASAGGAVKSGEEVYKQVCAACHASGAAGAPKFGDNGAWAPRIGAGLGGLMKTVLNGKGAMPARGGSSPDDVSDYELSRAVVFMVNSSGGKLAEPKAPEGTAAGGK